MGVANHRLRHTAHQSPPYPAVSLWVVDERRLSNVDYVQLGVSSLGQVGGSACCQLGLLGPVGGQQDRGGKDAHWESLLTLFAPCFGTMMPSVEASCITTNAYSPKCVEGGTLRTSPKRSSKKFGSIDDGRTLQSDP